MISLKNVAVWKGISGRALSQRKWQTYREGEQSILISRKSAADKRRLTDVPVVAAARERRRYARSHLRHPLLIALETL